MIPFPSQWTISELACYTYSLVAVPLYDTLGREAISYIIDKGIVRTPSSASPGCPASEALLQCGSFSCVLSVPATISTVICDMAEKAWMVLDCGNGKGTSVKMIVIMEAFQDDLVERAQECDIEIISFKEFEVWITFCMVSTESTLHSSVFLCRTSVLFQTGSHLHFFFLTGSGKRRYSTSGELRPAPAESSPQLWQSGDELSVPKYSIMPFPIAARFIFWWSDFSLLHRKTSRLSASRLEPQVITWWHDMMWLLIFFSSDKRIFVLIFFFQENQKGQCLLMEI